MKIARTFMHFYAHTVSGQSFFISVSQGEVLPLLESCLRP